MANDAPKTTPHRDEERITLNLRRYLDALGQHGHHQMQADFAKRAMASALHDLRAAGGQAEAERYAANV